MESNIFDQTEPIPGGRQNATFRKLFLLIVTTVLVSFCLSLVSCYSTRKAERQFSRAAATFPQIPARYCAATFPAVNRVDSFVMFTPGQTVWHTDTVAADCPQANGSVKVIRVPCPPVSTRVDTIEVTRNTVTVNRAAVDSAVLYAAQEHDGRLVAENSRNNWRKAFIAMVAVLVILILIKRFI